jgi:hypothetical protein
MYRHPVAAFPALACGISWTIRIPSFLSESGIGVLPFQLNPLPFNVLAVIFGITLSAYIVMRVTRGREGFPVSDVMPQLRRPNHALTHPCRAIAPREVHHGYARHTICHLRHAR